MRAIAFIENTIAIFFLSVTISSTTIQIISRHIMANPMAWTEELSRYTFIAATFFGSVIAVREGQHVALKVLLPILPYKIVKLIHVFIPIICILIILVTLPSVTIVLSASATSFSIVMGIPMATIYAVWPTAAGFMLIHFSHQVFLAFSEFNQK
jgi:TRAP-type C4-dicarboxylate transport system permease small subunit